MSMIDDLSFVKYCTKKAWAKGNVQAKRSARFYARQFEGTAHDPQMWGFEAKRAQKVSLRCLRGRTLPWNFIYAMLSAPLGVH